MVRGWWIGGAFGAASGQGALKVGGAFKLGGEGGTLGIVQRNLANFTEETLGKRRVHERDGDACAQH